MRVPNNIHTETSSAELVVQCPIPQVFFFIFFSVLLLGIPLLVVKEILNAKSKFYVLNNKEFITETRCKLWGDFDFLCRVEGLECLLRIIKNKKLNKKLTRFRSYVLSDIQAILERLVHFIFYGRFLRTDKVLTHVIKRLWVNKH